MSNDESRRFAAGGPAAIVVRTPEEAARLAKRLAGEDDKRILFFCLTCGWKSTMEFSDDEIEAMPTGSARDYPGPCPGCQSMTLRPFDEMFGGTETINDMAKRNRRSEYEEAADVFLDRAVNKFIGGIPTPPASPSAADSNAPAWAQNLDDSPVDPNAVKPRGGR
jgi:hypothetical protein